MSVSNTVILPAQPTLGIGTLFTPFGGDGRSAPLGVYDVDVRVVGDAGAGTASLTIQYDNRYTMLCSYCMAYVNADTAAGEFSLQLTDTDISQPNVHIVGTLPGVAEAFQGQNSVYLWFPPPIWLSGAGTVVASYLNVDATETYGLSAQIYAFDRNVRQIAAAQWLNLVRVGVNSPVAS